MMVGCSWAVSFERLFLVKTSFQILSRNVGGDSASVWVSVWSAEVTIVKLGPKRFVETATTSCWETSNWANASDTFSTRRCSGDHCDICKLSVGGRADVRERLASITVMVLKTSNFLSRSLDIDLVLAGWARLGGGESKFSAGDRTAWTQFFKE